MNRLSDTVCISGNKTEKKIKTTKMFLDDDNDEHYYQKQPPPQKKNKQPPMKTETFE